MTTVASRQMSLARRRQTPEVPEWRTDENRQRLSQAVMRARAWPHRLAGRGAAGGCCRGDRRSPAVRGKARTSPCRRSRNPPSNFKKYICALQSKPLSLMRMAMPLQRGTYAVFDKHCLRKSRCWQIAIEIDSRPSFLEMRFFDFDLAVA